MKSKNSSSGLFFPLLSYFLIFSDIPLHLSQGLFYLMSYFLPHQDILLFFLFLGFPWLHQVFNLFTAFNLSPIINTKEGRILQLHVNVIHGLIKKVQTYSKIIEEIGKSLFFVSFKKASSMGAFCWILKTLPHLQLSFMKKELFSFSVESLHIT